MSKKLEDSKLSIDLADYWMIIQKRIISVFLIFILVMVITVYYTMNTVPEYSSSMTLKLALRQPMAQINGTLITLFANRGNGIPSEIKLIKNKVSLLNDAIDVLQKGTQSKIYVENPDFFIIDGKKNTKRDDYLKIFKSIDSTVFSPNEANFIKKLSPSQLSAAISIYQLPKTNMIELSIHSPFPTLCQKIANVIAVVYMIDFWKSKTLEAQKSMEFISKQLELERNKLKKTDKVLDEIRTRGVFLGSEEIYKEELTKLRIKLKRERESYKDKHPRIIKLKKLIEQLENDLKEIPISVKQTIITSKNKSIQKNFLATLEELQLKANIDYQATRNKALGEIQVIAWAGHGRKVKPNIRLYIVAGVLLGIIFGVLFAFVLEGLDTSISKIEDVERITELPVIAHIPLIGMDEKNPSIKLFKEFVSIIYKIFTFFVPLKTKEGIFDLDSKVLFNFDSMSVVAEAYRTLRTNVQFSIGGNHEECSVIAITSTSPREGKTITATNLSIALSQMGKRTLLIEADMRRPQISKLFHIKQKPGLSDVLIGTVKPNIAIRTITDILLERPDWDSLMKTQGIDNLNILTCGTLPPNPTELLISSEFKIMLDQLKNDYDFIIIDTPPSLPVSDASIVGAVVDGTIIIYQSDTTSRHLLLRAIQNLRKNRAKLLGVVINQLSFDVTLHQKNSYGYSYSSQE
jgi:tyrosine-protein kinase Etk/Wzc